MINWLNVFETKGNWSFCLSATETILHRSNAQLSAAIICVDTTVVVKIEFPLPKLHVTCVECISHGSGCIQHLHQVKHPKTSLMRSEMAVLLFKLWVSPPKVASILFFLAFEKKNKNLFLSRTGIPVRLASNLWLNGRWWWRERPKRPNWE